MKCLALLALGFLGCGSGPRPIIDTVRPVDEDLLKLVPSGADLILDFDMEQLRRWAPAARLWALLPAESRARLDGHGIDPFADLDGAILSMSGLGGGEPSSLLLLRGTVDVEKFARGLGDAVESAEYRGARIREAGERAIARLTPSLVVHGSRADVRRVIDLLRGDGVSLRNSRGDRALLEAFARAPSAIDGRPALIGGLVPTEILRERIKTDRLPGSEYQWLTVVMAVGDGFDFEIIGKTKSEVEAAQLAASAKRSFEEWRARPMVALFGLRPYFDEVVVKEKGDEVRLVWRVPARRLDQALARIEQIWALGRRK